MDAVKPHVHELPNFAKAKQTADSLTWIFSSPPIPVLDIAESNGVNVVVVDFGEYREEVSGLCDFKSKRIYVNKDDRLNRIMYAIAHELGHWLLHRDLFTRDPDLYSVLPRFTKPDQSRVVEREAVYFASNLLMPSKLLYPVRDAGAAWISWVFDVSREMVENRLKGIR